MKKYFVVSLLFFLTKSQLVFGQINAHKSWSFSAGPELILPERKLSKTHGIGFGATAKGEYVFGEHAAAIIASGFYSVPGKINNSSLNVVPLKGGVRYYLGNFYAQGEIGAAFLFGYISQTKFLYSAGMGDKFPVGRYKIDISLRHEGWVSKGWGIAGLRVAFEF